MNKRGGSNKRGGWTNLKIMINVEGRFLCGGWDKFCEKNKRGSTFIRQERVSKCSVVLTKRAARLLSLRIFLSTLSY